MKVLGIVVNALLLGGGEGSSRKAGAYTRPLSAEREHFLWTTDVHSSA